MLGVSTGGSALACRFPHTLAQGLTLRIPQVGDFPNVPATGLTLG